jgi:hypothetical protein
VSIDWLDEQPKPVADAIERIAERAGTWEASCSVLVAAGELLSAAEGERDALKAALTEARKAAFTEALGVVSYFRLCEEDERDDNAGKQVGDGTSYNRAVTHIEDALVKERDRVQAALSPHGEGTTEADGSSGAGR